MCIKSKMYKYIYLCYLLYPTPVLTWDWFILHLLKLLETVLHCDLSIRGGWVRLAGVFWGFVAGLTYQFGNSSNSQLDKAVWTLAYMGALF